MIDYLDVSNEKNKKGDYKKTDVLSVSGEVGIVKLSEFQGRSFAGVSVENYGIVNEGDVVSTKSPLKANPYGVIKTNKGIAGFVSTLYAVYKPKENTDSNFVQIYFELDSRMNSYMHPLVNKGAKNDMKVSDENALKGKVTFPKKNEQKAISNFITELDHLITLHQRKCCELKKLKQYMANHMFVNQSTKCDRDIATNHKKLQERTKEMGELESVIEQRLIDQLCGGDSQWTYRKDIRTEEQLWDNFKYILEQNNKAKLNDMPLSESEFAKIKNDVSHASFYDAG